MAQYEDDDEVNLGTMASSPRTPPVTSSASSPAHPYRRSGNAGSSGTNPYARSAAHRGTSSVESSRSDEIALASGSRSPKGPGSYRRGDCIGRGANGTVYQGICTTTGSLVAIKEVSVPRGDSNFAKLTQEVRLMARLSHANIVDYLGAELDEAKGTLRIYQEWVPGGSIDSLLAKFGGTFGDGITV